MAPEEQGGRRMTETLAAVSRERFRMLSDGGIVKCGHAPAPSAVQEARPVTLSAVCRARIVGQAIPSAKPSEYLTGLLFF